MQKTTTKRAIVHGQQRKPAPHRFLIGPGASVDEPPFGRSVGIRIRPKKKLTAATTAKPSGTSSHPSAAYTGKRYHEITTARCSVKVLTQSIVWSSHSPAFDPPP